MSRLTRRELAAALSTAALSSAAILKAQEQSASGQPTPSQSAPSDELTAARAQLRANSDQLDKFPLPMAAEPATVFKP